ncbi:regulator of G-protein signaling 8 isoform X5 [Gopherus flavomarginatus]|uniref:regulator of G-protein signaling 8 isoform X5 n=1 Tax=Gopherus flavomarginatus TaxID=286002 RepID=UPI0021CC44B0|nr:regulator of G-protein signaling 8 isoform X5 [Gopherus flavomarginatus]
MYQEAVDPVIQGLDEPCPSSTCQNHVATTMLTATRQSLSDHTIGKDPQAVRTGQRQRLSTEEATRWADSFDRLLSHKYGVAAFRAFLKTEFSEENLEFWLACEEFKKTRSTTKLASKAHRIFEEFIDVQAPREVNIDFQTREVTRNNVQEPSLSCFDQAQGKVHSLMEKDSYPRFLRSKIYTDLLTQTQRRLS